MDWNHYFDFLNEDDIRLKGTRVGIETVLDDYLNGASPEEIAARYHSLTLEQVYATITYYLGHQAEVDAYLVPGFEGARQLGTAVVFQTYHHTELPRPYAG